MEAEERPAKMRKSTHEGDGEGVSKSISHFDTSALGSEHHEQLDRDDLLQNGQAKQQTPAATDENLAHDLQLQVDMVRNDELPPPDETAPLATSDEVMVDGPTMSKNQMKKLRKKQEWEAKRDDRKLIRKEKMVAMRERKRVARRQDHELQDQSPQPPKKASAQRPVQLPVTFLIDCDFDDLMRDNERISLASQITRCYSDNKNSMFRAHLAVCCFTGKLRERFDTILTHYKGWRNVRFLDCDFFEAAEQAKTWMADDQSGGKLAGTFSTLSELEDDAQAMFRDEGEVVYLSSEAQDTLTELNPYSTYIIGGLVDKNREKGICYKRATQRGVRTAKLPIVDYLRMSSRKVLATNHVNEIMLKWLECGDWGQAFMKVIPKRKGGQLKSVEAGGNNDGDEVTEDGAHDTGDDESEGGVLLETDGDGLQPSDLNGSAATAAEAKDVS